MIQVIDNATDEVLNDFPGLPGVVAFCEGEPDLWRLSFWDTNHRRWISWVQVEEAMVKRNQWRNNGNGIVTGLPADS